MKLSKFVERLQNLAPECVGAHPTFDDALTFWYDDGSEDGVYLDLADIEVQTTIGCGCWTGLTIELKPQSDSDTGR